MVIAMKDVSKFFNAWIIAYPMKNEAMCNVFEKAPEKYSAEKYQYNSCCRITNVVAAIVKHGSDNR